MCWTNISQRTSESVTFLTLHLESKKYHSAPVGEAVKFLSKEIASNGILFIFCVKSYMLDR